MDEQHEHSEHIFVLFLFYLFSPVVSWHVLIYIPFSSILFRFVSFTPAERRVREDGFGRKTTYLIA
jgi:hypothetical protein